MSRVWLKIEERQKYRFLWLLCQGFDEKVYQKNKLNCLMIYFMW